MHLRSKEPGNANIFPARCGHRRSHARETCCCFKVRLHIYNDILRVKNSHQVTGNVCLPGTCTESPFHFIGDICGCIFIGGKIHQAKLSVPAAADGEPAAEDLKGNFLHILVIKIKQNKGSPQGGVTAEVYFAPGSKPAQAVYAPLSDCKGGLGKIILPGNVPHKAVRRHFVRYADRCLIAGKHLVRKTVDDILLHFEKPPQFLLDNIIPYEV